MFLTKFGNSQNKMAEEQPMCFVSVETSELEAMPLTQRNPQIMQLKFKRAALALQTR